MRTLLVTFECLPRRWIGCYGGMQVATPGFDTVAVNGVTFDLCFMERVAAFDSRIFGLDVRSVGREGAVDVAGTPMQLPVWVNEPEESEDALSNSLIKGLDWLSVEESPHRFAWVSHPGIRTASWPWIDEDDDLDVAESIKEIDEAIAEFLPEWREVAGDDWRLVIAAASGLARGDKTADAEADVEQLCDDLIHVPLWIVEGAGVLYGARHQELCTPAHVAVNLKRWLGADSQEGITLPVEVISQSSHGAVSIRTADWFLRGRIDATSNVVDRALFQKPEDVCEAFNVAQMKEGIAEKLVQRLLQNLSSDTPAQPRTSQ